MSAALRRLAVDRLAAGRPTAVVEVRASRGSVPRDAGTRMLVWDGGLAGTIGGGRLEWEAIAAARAALAGSAPWPPDSEIALGASLGQCCGGAVTLRHRPLDAAAIAAWTPPPPATIQVYGAGHVGRAVVRLLETLDDVRVQWLDERDDAFVDAFVDRYGGRSASPTVDCVVTEPVDAEVAAAPPDAFYLVLTHRHDLDLRIVEAVVRRGDFAFLGLIGSTTKRRRFEQQLASRGIGAATLARIVCPIGIDGIDGKEPSVIAIATVAQVLQAMSARAATR